MCDDGVIQPLRFESRFQRCSPGNFPHGALAQAALRRALGAKQLGWDSPLSRRLAPGWWARAPMLSLTPRFSEVHLACQERNRLSGLGARLGKTAKAVTDPMGIKHPTKAAC